MTTDWDQNWAPFSRLPCFRSFVLKSSKKSLLRNNVNNEYFSYNKRYAKYDKKNSAGKV